MAEIFVGERERKLDVEVFRNQKILPQLGAKALNTAGSIQYIAVVGHFAAEIPDFRRNHLSAVRSGLERGRHAVFFHEAGFCPFEADGEVVKAVDGAGVPLAGGRFPGEEGSVAGNLVYVSAVFRTTVREQPVVVLHETAVLDMAELFGKFR